MAKRRKLTAPSADDLDRMEDEFRRETSPASPLAPIAQVAAETAAEAPVLSPEDRLAHAEAEALRLAREEGRLITRIPLDEIDEATMVRDRVQLMQHELDELRHSIALSGLRLPVEVYPLAEGAGAPGRKYGLISGYRRLLAFRAMAELEPEKYGTIPAIIREPKEAPDAIAAMVEENEIRAQLTPFERGRIAVIAAQNGAFTNVEEAVDRLFTHASRAKRSKVRSYARVFESLGDLIAFPEALTEKQGLRLAAALRAGAEAKLREALDLADATEPEEEWAALEPVVRGAEDRARDPSRGGRPSKKKAAAKRDDATVIDTHSGIRLRRVHDGKGYAIRFEGSRADMVLVEEIMREVARLLDRG